MGPTLLLVSLAFTIKDHKLTPQTATAPHGERLELVVTNAGPGPEEIESKSLRFEKLIPEGQTVTLRVGPLKAATYDVFGDFHADTCKAVLTVQ